ncbi:hypothetical protein BKA70DRAFT_1113270 [Coprinopsis sp. MPI-PUGE-AT-0042]|nr:hypothetical protein BKA70DRAFT_1113270 [Coprinopsis sp. MPI-PUGE-AT-0042]
MADDSLVHPLGRVQGAERGNVPFHVSLLLYLLKGEHSGRASSLSKSQSLIKKNIELQDLKPADILIERFMSWKAIVKQLCMYFEGIADIENNTAKEMMKLSGLIQVPFRSGNQFLGEGGLQARYSNGFLHSWQDVYYSIRDKSKTIADQHANLGRTIDSSIVQHLQKLLVEIKAHIRNVQNDTGKLASSVAHERTTSTRLVGDLANSISLSKNTPLSLPARSDPYIANTLVRHQLGRQVLEENLLQKSLVIMQQNSAHFEEGIVRSIKSAWATFEEWRSRTQGVTSEMWSIPETLMASIESDREWIAFAARSDHLLDPETPLRDPELINYPLKDDPSTQALHTGFMSMMRRGGKEWKESWYVLTPSGYLHEFASSDTSTPSGQIPTFSLFLPHCTLGPATPANAAVHGFHIEAVPSSSSNGMGSSGSTASLGGGRGLKALLAPLGKKESSGALGMGGNGLGGGGSGKVKSYTFRARSHEEKMEWWNDLRMLCARYLVASEVVRRSGPVERTVRGVGYAEEDLYDSEEELEEEELYNDAEVYHNPAAQRYTQEGQGVVYRGTEGGEYEGASSPPCTGRFR